MILQLSPETEARVQAQARAQGIEAESFVQKLIEDAVRPAAPRRAGPVRDLRTFFATMAAGSESLPVLSEEVSSRESFYRIMIDGVRVSG